MGEEPCRAGRLGGGLLRAGRLSPTHLLFPLGSTEHPQAEIHSRLQGSVLGEFIGLFFARKCDSAVVVSHGEGRTRRHLRSRQPAVSASHNFICLGRRVPAGIAPFLTRGSGFVAVGSRAGPGEGRGREGGGQGEVAGGSRGRPRGLRGAGAAAPERPRCRARMRDPGKAPGEHKDGGRVRLLCPRHFLRLKLFSRF